MPSQSAVKLSSNRTLTSEAAPFFAFRFELNPPQRDQSNAQILQNNTRVEKALEYNDQQADRNIKRKKNNVYCFVYEYLPSSPVCVSEGEKGASVSNPCVFIRQRQMPQETMTSLKRGTKNNGQKRHGGLVVATETNNHKARSVASRSVLYSIIHEYKCSFFTCIFHTALSAVLPFVVLRKSENKCGGNSKYQTH